MDRGDLTSRSRPRHPAKDAKEEKKNGKDYRQRISEAGRPNLQGWADSRREAFLQLVEKTEAELDPDLAVQRAAERKIPTEEPGRLDRPVDGKRADRRRGRPGDKRRHVVTASDLVGDESFEGQPVVEAAPPPFVGSSSGLLEAK